MCETGYGPARSEAGIDIEKRRTKGFDMRQANILEAWLGSRQLALFLCILVPCPTTSCRCGDIVTLLIMAKFIGFKPLIINLNF